MHGLPLQNNEPMTHAPGGASKREAVDLPRNLIIVARLFAIDPQDFVEALHALPQQAAASTTPKSVKRLLKASLGLRHVIPEEFIPRWAHERLPHIAESPLDILKGDNGYEEFVRLVEGIIHGDFA
jgi:hypothetical protein